MALNGDPTGGSGYSDGDDLPATHMTSIAADVGNALDKNGGDTIAGAISLEAAFTVASGGSIRERTANESSTSTFTWGSEEIIRYTGSPGSDVTGTLPTPVGIGGVSKTIVACAPATNIPGSHVFVRDPSTATDIARMDWGATGSIAIYSDGTNWRIRSESGSAFDQLDQW